MKMNSFLAFIYGVLFGAGNLIPGLSGGMMLAAFGCYDTAIGALAVRRKDIGGRKGFLIPFLAGTVLGIAAFVFLLSALIEKYPVPVYLFLVGLIIGSFPLILRTAAKQEKLRVSRLFPALLSAGVIVLIVLAQSGGSSDAYTLEQAYSADDRNVTVVRLKNETNLTIREWSLEFPAGSVTAVGGARLVNSPGVIDQIKALLGGADEAKPNAITGHEEDMEIGPKQTVIFTYVPENGPKRLDFDVRLSYTMSASFLMTLVLGSFLAAAAMLVPGMSAVFVMALFGIYSTVLSALEDGDLLILALVGVSMLCGLILGARGLNWLLQRHSAAAYCLMLGLAAGAVFAIFPREFVLDMQLIAGVAAMIVGGAISVTVNMEKKSNEELQKTGKNLK